MKKLLAPILFLILSSTAFAQLTFDLGIKAGFNNSKLSLNKDDYSSKSIQKMHYGAFGRIGVGRIYAQPEVYFSKKGGEISSNVVNAISSFDYNNIDVPVLLGFKIIKGGPVNLHIKAGPVFSFVTKSDIDGSYDPEYFNDHYFGLQYGVGVDIFFITIDARMEHGNAVYDNTSIGLEGKNSTFMVAVGIKFL
ncbi:PorT family protein [Draconibacterium sp.]|nr:PorT family protein [Draconibacterium sp.]